MFMVLMLTLVKCAVQFFQCSDLYLTMMTMSPVVDYKLQRQWLFWSQFNSSLMVSMVKKLLCFRYKVNPWFLISMLWRLIRIRPLFLKLNYFKFPVSTHKEGYGMAQGRALHCKCKQIFLAYRSLYWAFYIIMLSILTTTVVSSYRCEKISIQKESSSVWWQTP